MTLPSMQRAAGFLLALVLPVCAAAAPAAPPDLEQAERQVVEQTNRFRREEGAAAVRPNRPLEQAARAFAQFMARSGEYGHQADGREPVQRTRAAGYDECLVAENIAFQYSSAGFDTQEAFLVIPKYRTGDRELSPMMSLTLGGGTRIGLNSERASIHYAVIVSGEMMYSQYFDSIFIVSRTAWYGTVGLDVEF